MIDILDHKLTFDGIPTFKPTLEEEKFIRDAMAYLVVRSPFFAHLLYNQCKIVYSLEIPHAATDGKHLIFNPAGLKAEGMGLLEIAFVIAHEVGHCLFGDLLLAAKFRDEGVVRYNDGTELPYVHEVMNIAEDYRINAMLVKSAIGKMPMKNGKPFGMYDTNISADGMESAGEIYRKIFKQESGGSGGQRFDVHMQPGKAAKDDDAAGGSAMKGAIAAAVQAAQAAGTGALPGVVMRMLGDILEPKVSWQEKMNTTINRACGDPAYDWRTIDRRLLVRPNPIYFARQVHTGAGLIGVVIDTSGSISDEIVNRFFGEMGGIVTDVNPAQMIVLWVDAKVQRVDDLDEPDELTTLHADINENGHNGGGGTRFQPAFDWFHEEGLEPECLIYFTDGYGDRPKDPGYPVVWAIIEGGKKDFVDYGDWIDVEL